MHPGNARGRVHPGRVMPKTWNDPARADEYHSAIHEEAPRPSGEARHGLEPAVFDDADLAVAAVVHPQPAPMEPRGMRPRETRRHHVARPPREDHAPAVDGKVQVTWTSRRRSARRRGEVALPDRPPGGDRVQLKIVAAEARPPWPVDRVRPPYRPEAPVFLDGHDGVEGDGVGVKLASDEREVVDVQRPREVPGLDRHER